MVKIWNKDTPITEKLDYNVIGWKWCDLHNPPKYVRKEEWTQKGYKTLSIKYCKKCGEDIKKEIKDYNLKTHIGMLIFIY